MPRGYQPLCPQQFAHMYLHALSHLSEKDDVQKLRASIVEAMILPTALVASGFMP